MKQIFTIRRELQKLTQPGKRMKRLRSQQNKLVDFINFILNIVN